MFSSIFRPLAVSCVLALGLPLLADAAPTPYSETGFTHSALGDNLGSTFDQLSLSNAQGSVNLKPGGIMELGTLSFVVGPNCNPCTATPSYADSFSFTLGGISETAQLRYRWSSDGTTDTLTFSPISTLLFDLGGQLLAVRFDDLNPLATQNGKTVRESLEARISPVPEPSPYVSLAAGLLAMLGVTRRRAAR